MSPGAELRATDGVTVVHHECTDPARGWTSPKLIDRHGLVLLRSGGFRRRIGANEAYVGPSMAFFEPHGGELQTAHPHGAPDSSTLFFFTDAAVERLAGDRDLPEAPIVTSGAVDLAHRRLMADLGRHDGFEAEERVADLVGMLIEQAAPGRLTSARRTATAVAHRRLVDATSEAIMVDPVGADLRTLASAVGCSPFHLSRTFRQAIGMTLTRFRSRVRAAMALDRLEGGERDLAGLAVELGFADQAHMTRVVRAELGAPPGEVRGTFHLDRRRDSIARGSRGSRRTGHAPLRA